MDRLVLLEDLQSIGCVSTLGKRTLQKIGELVGDLIQSYDYWTCLEIACDKCGVKRIIN